MTSESTSYAYGQAVVNRILLVEDDLDTAEAIRAILEREGYEVLTAKEGGQAHSMFAMRKPDFVILDLMLPGESGFEICERLKHIDRDTPVLVLSAISLPDSIKLAKRVGADEYLTKPFDPALLVQAIRVTAERVWKRSHGIENSAQGQVKFYCTCGKKFKMASVHRGKTLTCPNCGESVIVPRHD